jgi:phenylacetate-CoA ligase
MMSITNIVTDTFGDDLVYPPGYQERCEQALVDALERTPAYASWRRFDPGSDFDVFQRLAALPMLTKRELRSFGPQGFIPGGRDLQSALDTGEVELVNTSGTSSDQVTNIWYQAWWNESEANSWQLNRYAREAATGNHLEAILTSPLCSGIPCEEGYLSLDERRLGRFQFLNERSDPRTWDDALMARMVKEINAYQPVLLEANPSFLAILARYILRSGRKMYRPALITLTYENPSLLHYKLIRQAFGAPIASSYGATEAGYVFMECEEGHQHQVTDNVHLDFLPFKVEQGGPQIGQILVTTLNNPWRALLRFDIGDLVRLLEYPCPCGQHHGLTIQGIEGRTINLTKTPAGKSVTQGEVDRALVNVTGMVEYQLTQTTPTCYALDTVAEGADAAIVAANARDALFGVYGARACIEARSVQAIAPDPPGKYRLVKSMVDIDVAQLIEPRFVPRSHGG